MAFLDLGVRSPGVPISLLVFKKEFQIRPCGWRIAFDDHPHITSCSVYQATKLVIALIGIGSDQASFAQDLRQQGLERAHFIVFLSYWTLLQDNACVYLIHVQYLLLRLFSLEDLFARAMGAVALVSHHFSPMLAIPGTGSRGYSLPW